MGSFEFEYPEAFIILILFFICFYFCKAKIRAIFFPNVETLKSAGKSKTIFKNVLKFLVILFLTIALASPIKKDEIKIQNSKGYEISLILDASGSMGEYHKFDIVKSIVLDFIKKRKNDKIGLTIFADFAYVAVPLTYDKDSLVRLLKEVNVGIAGVSKTALYEALFMSARLFKNSKAKNKIAILLTDGQDNVGNIPLDVAINTLKRYGIKVYTIGIGDYNRAVLEEIANKTGGKFYDARSKEDLENIYKEIDKLEKSKIKAQKYIKKSYYFEYFLMLAFITLSLLILGYRR